MTLTVRLDPKLERALDRYCRKHRVTRSELITKLLAGELADPGAARPSAYELAEQLGLVGAFASGRGDLSTTYKSKLKDKLRAKHAR